MKLNYKVSSELIVNNISNYTIVDTDIHPLYIHKLLFEIQDFIEDFIVFKNNYVVYKNKKYHKSIFIWDKIKNNTDIKYIIINEHLSDVDTVYLVEHCKYNSIKIIVINNKLNKVDYNINDKYSDLFDILDLNTNYKIYNLNRKEKIKRLLNGN